LHSYVQGRSQNTARKLAQGVGSALLVFAGADSISNGAAGAEVGMPPLVDLGSFDGLTQSLLQGGLTGPAQIAAAVLLYIAAGHSHSRLFGFAIGVAAAALYLQGVTLEDVSRFASHFSRRIGAAAAAFQAA
jgi:hypothetical protein